MGSIAGAAVAAALTVALGGCSVYEDLTTSDFAKQGPDAIIESASEAMREVTSLRLVGQVRDGGRHIFVDLRVDRSGTCAGDLRLEGRGLAVIRTGSRTWVRGDVRIATLATGSRASASVRDNIDRSWVELGGATGLCDYDTILGGFDVVDFGTQDDGSGGATTGKKAKKAKKGTKGKASEEVTDLDGPVPATIDEETDLDGTAVVKLTGTPGGTHDETVWVSSDEPHRVLKIESTDGRSGGTLSLSNFDEPVEVDPPAAKDVLKP